MISSPFLMFLLMKPVSGYTVLTVSPDSNIKLSEVVLSLSVVSLCLQTVKNTCSVDCIPAFDYN